MATRFGEASSALNDLTKKSVMKSQGPPTLYRLQTTRSNLDETGKVRKWTFGQQYPNMQNKSILLVGETGTGKTTLIDTMVNHYLGVRFEDKVWFEITEEEKKGQTESQTSEITVYEVISEQKPFSLTIIDTPGYGDTRGIDKDMEIAQNLFRLFQHDTGVKDLDGVCLVLKASQNRVSDRQRYIFEGVLSLFGKDIQDNIVLFVTYSDGETPTDALEAIDKEKIPCCRDADNEPVHFLFNNRQSKMQTGKKKNPANIRYSWEMAEGSLEEFFTFLESRQRKSLTLTLSVLKERIELEACVQSLKDRIEFMEAKLKELTGQKNALKLNKEQIEKDENYIFTVKIVYKEKVEITGASWWDRKATSCDECKENCHEYGCWFAPYPSACEVMENKCCIVCKCPPSEHAKEAKKYVTKWKEEKVTLEDLKRKYINGPGENVTYDEKKFKQVDQKHKTLEEQIKGLERCLENLKAENEIMKKSTVREAYEVIIKLSEIALKPDSAFTIQHLDFLIPRLEEAGETVWVQKLKDLQKAAAKESTMSAMRYLGLKIKSFFSGK